MLHLFAYIPVDVYIWTVYTDNTWQGENVTFLLASHVNKHGPGETNKSIKSLHLAHYFKNNHGVKVLYKISRNTPQLAQSLYL